MSKTILIVEDEKAFQDLYTVMFEETDYNIIRAYDADQAMTKLEEQKPDLIILDILLDLVTGDTFFLHLKRTSEYARIPVIIASSFSSKTYKHLQEIDPTLVFLEKPFTKGKLLESVRAKLDEEMSREKKWG
ncbi:MAG TPA: response regulator [Candidatus Brocadiia bacterium]|nr:response regulator [Planctomycetota bacterium]MDO8093251.1 response regulator [Candidatus Brocadiales bacterium]